jgi:hypothetical protein
LKLTQTIVLVKFINQLTLYKAWFSASSRAAYVIFGNTEFSSSLDLSTLNGTNGLTIRDAFVSFPFSDQDSPLATVSNVAMEDLASAETLFYKCNLQLTQVNCKRTDPIGGAVPRRFG